MRLLEYEAKGLLAGYGAPIPAGQLVVQYTDKLLLPFPQIIKAQIPTGGRGKAGGVKPVYTNSEFRDAARELLNRPILGYRAKTLLAEEMLEVRREIYLAIVLDRPGRSLMLLAHKEGGIDIETVASQSDIFKIPLANKPDRQTTQQLLEYTGLAENMRRSVENLLTSMWDTCVQSDALLVEINPLIITPDDRLVCADAKIEVDDSAAYRHNWDFEQKPASAQFVVLNTQGTVGSMANGAGLAMATVDAIQNAGAVPVNFLDVGGGANARTMANAFRQLSKMPNVRSIVVNIFGGITRCDEVAQAIVMARESVNNLPALFIRLTGTNETKGRKILESAGIITLPDLTACVESAVHEVHNV